MRKRAKVPDYIWAVLSAMPKDFFSLVTAMTIPSSVLAQGKLNVVTTTEDLAAIDLLVKAGLAQMLKGGVIMDVVNAEQAKIAEDAGEIGLDHQAARGRVRGLLLAQHGAHRERPPCRAGDEDRPHEEDQVDVQEHHHSAQVGLRDRT